MRKGFRWSSPSTLFGTPSRRFEQVEYTPFFDSAPIRATSTLPTPFTQYLS